LVAVAVATGVAVLVALAVATSVATRVRIVVTVPVMTGVTVAPWADTAAELELGKTAARARTIKINMAT